MENIKKLTNKGLPTAKAFSNSTVKAAESTCIEDDPAKSGWFADARSILEPLIEMRNKTSELLKEQPSESNQSAFKEARPELERATRTANNRSEFKKATAIMRTMQSKPGEAWAKM